MHATFAWFASAMLLVAVDVEYRTWTDASGKYTIEAEMTSIIGDKVSLKTRDGRTIQIPAADLSSNDRKFIDDWKVRKAKKANPSTVPGGVQPQANKPKAGRPPANRIGPETALAKKLKFEFAETPLRDALRTLSAESGAPLLLDEANLDAKARNAVPTLTGKSAGRTFHEELAALLAPLEYGFAVVDDAIVVGPKIESGRFLQRRTYRVVDPRILALPPGIDLAVGTSPRGEALDALMNELTEIEPSSWQSSGGIGAAHALTPSRIASANRGPWGYSMISVFHTYEVHRRINDRFATRLLVVDPEEALGSRKVKPRVAPVFAALERPVDYDFAEAPLDEVLKGLAAAQRVPLLFDEQSLADGGVDLKSVVAAMPELNGMKLSSALAHVLRTVRCDFFADSEGIHVGTQEFVEGRLYPVAYDISGLSAQDLDGLSDLIAMTVAPTRWAEVGGPCKRDIVSQPGVLQVTADYRLHQALTTLLVELGTAFDEPKIKRR